MSAVPPEIPTPQVPGEPSGLVDLLRRAAELPGRCLQFLIDKLTSLSFAAKISWFIFSALLAVVLVFWFGLQRAGDVPWKQTLPGERIIVVGLLIAIPITVYKTVRYWAEGVSSDYPDILSAWQSGLATLRENGIKTDEHPLFLLIGATNLVQESSLMSASGQEFLVEATPSGPVPLHFYATADAIYIFLSDAAWITGLARASGQPRLVNPDLFDGQAANESASPAVDMDEFSRMTLDLATFMEQRQKLEEQGFGYGGGIKTTLKPGAISYATDKTVKLSAQESIELTSRLEFVGRLISAARHPLCPINGVMVLVPFHLLNLGEESTREIQRAIRSDMNSLQTTLRLRAPTITLFTGLEQEPGFRELVRRVGPAAASRQRFGHGLDVRVRATVEELRNLSAHSCGAFEDWVYTLFREDGALTRPGNTLLHSLLVTVRSKLKEPITEVVSRGLGVMDNSTPEEEVSVAGCYFAATGPSEDQQAFVRGVFDKLRDEQEDLEWLPQARRRGQKLRGLFVSGIVTSIVLSIIFVALIWTNTAK